MAGGAVSQTPGFGFDAAAAGGFPGMPFGADFNQMQMMMAMQNGMNPSAFGNFPIMGTFMLLVVNRAYANQDSGMPGMNMDPMMMQNMFMNGGFGAGMNGMNIGMGMGGFDGGVGSGFNNGWNGQQSWNVGPDNFNHPNASSMGHGDYGSNNSGYAQNAAGYNQGNYGRPNQYNDYQNNYGNQGFRGRGRGRGGFGRGGGYGHGVSNDAFSQQLPQQFGTGQQPIGPVSESGSAKAISKIDANVDEFGREIRAISEAKELVSSKTAEDGDATKEPEATIAEDGEQNGVTTEAGIHEDSMSMNNENVPMPIQTLDDISGSYQQDYNGNTYGPGRGGYGQGAYYGGRGGFSSMQPPFVKPVDVPINAPTGPKAMREGLPNTSIAYLRRNGYPVSGTEVQRPDTSASASAAPEHSEKDRTERERTLSPSRDRDRDRSHSKSKERKRSRSRDRHRSHRHRDRSASPTEDDQEIERRREKRREARRRHEEEDATRATEVNGNKKPDEEKITDDPLEEELARSASPSESKRSSHRSRRDKEKYRERERDSDREHKSSSHRRRSHRDRSRSRDRDDDRGSDRKRDSGKDRDREKDREHRDRDREHRHRSSHSRRHSVDKAEVKVDESNQEEPVQVKPALVNGANGTLEIKGASVRHKSTVDEAKIPTGPRGDRSKGSTTANASARPQSSRAKGHHESSHRSSHSRHESSNSRSARDQHQSSRGDSHKEPSSSSAKLAALTPPIKDPHELEREARNRERLLKEAQRIAGLTGALAGRKRSRDDGEEAVATSSGGGGGGGSKRNRKKGRRGGAVLDDGESEEARIARLEAEREGARWG